MTINTLSENLEFLLYPKGYKIALFFGFIPERVYYELKILFLYPRGCRKKTVNDEKQSKNSAPTFSKRLYKTETEGVKVDPSRFGG
jgi:hypothetical protein